VGAVVVVRGVFVARLQLCRAESNGSLTSTCCSPTACAVRNFDTATHFETAPELVDRKFNRPRVEDLEAGPAILGGVNHKLLKVTSIPCLVL
jgi:hypothetical protein